jgi:hypothetical protein
MVTAFQTVCLFQHLSPLPLPLFLRVKPSLVAEFRYFNLIPSSNTPHSTFFPLSFGTNLCSGIAKSKPHIPHSTDRALDKQIPSQPETQPGISVRNGPVNNMDMDAPLVNGMNGKRKSRGSITKNYKENSESEDDKPLVSFLSWC